MSFGQAISSGFRNYAKFDGRASRSEFWWFVLFAWLVSIVANVVDSILGFRVISGTTEGGSSFALAYNPGWLGLIVALVFLLPLLGLGVRRLHDTDRSGWWVLLWIVCCIGQIILIVWWAAAGTPGPNKHGNPPAG